MISKFTSEKILIQIRLDTQQTPLQGQKEAVDFLAL